MLSKLGRSVRNPSMLGSVPQGAAHRPLDVTTADLTAGLSPQPARRTANFATAAFAVGIVGVGVGTYLLLVPSRAPAPPDPSASRCVSASVTADSNGVMCRGRF